MIIKNLHHLGVPCKSKIKNPPLNRTQTRRSIDRSSTLRLSERCSLRLEPEGGILTTPGVYASFFWMDDETISLIKTNKLSDLSLDALSLFYRTNCFLDSKEKVGSSLRIFNVKEGHLPMQVLFEVTSSCNCECLACYHKGDLNSGEVRTSDLIKRIDTLADLGLSLFEITGGEPFIRQDLTTLLDKISSRGRNFYVVTNGSFLKYCDDKSIDSLRKGEGLAISIDGFRETHDKIRRFPGLFSRIEDGLKRLEGSKIPIYFISTIGEHNYKEVQHLLDFAMQYNSLLHLRPAIITGGALDNQLNSKDMHQLLADHLHHPLARNGFIATKKEIPESRYYGCGIRKRISIDSFGNLFPCVMDRSRREINIDLCSQNELVNRLERETKIYLNQNIQCANCEVNKEEIICGGFCRFSTTYKNGTTKKL